MISWPEIDTSVLLTLPVESQTAEMVWGPGVASAGIVISVVKAPVASVVTVPTTTATLWNSMVVSKLGWSPSPVTVTTSPAAKVDGIDRDHAVGVVARAAARERGRGRAQQREGPDEQAGEGQELADHGGLPSLAGSPEAMDFLLIVPHAAARSRGSSPPQEEVEPRGGVVADRLRAARGTLHPPPRRAYQLER